MTTMAPSGTPVGSTRQAPSSKPSLAFRVICSPIFRLQSRNLISVVGLREPKMTIGLPAGGVGPHGPLGNPNAEDHKQKRSEVIKLKSLAQQDDRQQSAEHRHQID